jgi:hypothetical protein
MFYIPAKTVDAWLKAPNLDPHKLIPAMMRFEPANLQGPEKLVRLVFSTIFTASPGKPTN